MIFYRVFYSFKCLRGQQFSRKHTVNVTTTNGFVFSQRCTVWKDTNQEM